MLFRFDQDLSRLRRVIRTQLGSDRKREQLGNSAEARGSDGRAALSNCIHGLDHIACRDAGDQRPFARQGILLEDAFRLGS